MLIPMARQDRTRARSATVGRRRAAPAARSPGGSAAWPGFTVIFARPGRYAFPGRYRAGVGRAGRLVVT